MFWIPFKWPSRKTLWNSMGCVTLLTIKCHRWLSTCFRSNSQSVGQDSNLLDTNKFRGILEHGDLASVFSHIWKANCGDNENSCITLLARHTSTIMCTFPHLRSQLTTSTQRSCRGQSWHHSKSRTLITTQSALAFRDLGIRQMRYSPVMMFKFQYAIRRNNDSISFTPITERKAYSY